MSAPYIAPVAALRAQLGVLSQALDAWSEREVAAGATASQTRAGHQAVAAIDDMINVLYKVRARLVPELRAGADERARRVDAMLAEARARREAGQ